MSQAMDYGEARLAALQRKRLLLEGDILNEQRHPEPDIPKLVALKRARLWIIDEIGRLQAQNTRILKKQYQATDDNQHQT